MLLPRDGVEEGVGDDKNDEKSIFWDEELWKEGNKGVAGGCLTGW